MDLHHQVPDFFFNATGGVKGKLSDYRGQLVILYFYPKDSTPGCTNESLDFKAHFEQFNQRNTVIFGVSCDSMTSHNKFKDKHEFPFELISDENQEMCNLFGVYKLKKMYGREYMGIERSTFIIDNKGLLVKEWRKVKVKGHVEEVLEAIKQFS